MNNPDNIPIPTPHDPSWYPPQKEYATIDLKHGVPMGRPHFTGALLDLPVEERKKHMWMVPKHLQDHPMYKEEDYGGRIKREDAQRKQKDEADKLKKEQDKDDTIKYQSRIINDLQKTLNTQAQDIQSLHTSLSQVIELLNKK